MGKLKGKIIKSGDGGVLRTKTDTGERIEYPYNQPFSRELGITEGTVVSFDLVTVKETQVAIAVNPVEKGEIAEIVYESGKGTIIETESGLKYPFVQPHAMEAGLKLGQTVKYTLVYIGGIPTATCLTIVS